MNKLVTSLILTTALGTAGVAAILSARNGSPAMPPVCWMPATPTDDRKPVAPTATAPQLIDVVFALDTTGSMGGLLDGAKRTIFSIASHIKQTNSNASLRIGVIAYRDLHEDYVTRVFPMTEDIDAVFADLTQLTAGGGGDMPEHVNQALVDALAMPWRDQAAKMVFLVGDAPPGPRSDAPDTATLAAQAGARQITINTVRCGGNDQTEQVWRQIAALAGGEYSSIAQDGGVREIATPYDAEMAKISRGIDESTIIYGDDLDRARYGRKMSAAAAAPAPTAASRADYYSHVKPSKGRDDKDLMAGVASGAVALESLDPAKLPAELRSLSETDRKAQIKAKIDERGRLQAELKELTGKRRAYLAKETAAADVGGFDAEVARTVDKTLAKKRK
jgi:von Willebrand factor type A domain